MIDMRFALVLFVGLSVHDTCRAQLAECLDSANAQKSMKAYGQVCSQCQQGVPTSGDAKGPVGAIGTAIARCLDGAISWCLANDGCTADLDCQKHTSACPKGPATTKTTAPPTAGPVGTTPTPSPAAGPAASTTPSATQQQCDQAAKDANNFCNNMSSAGSTTPSPAPNQSMTDYCKQMDQAAQSNTQANNRSGATCGAKIDTCKSTCTAAGDSDTANGCQSLTAKVRALGNQGLASTSSSASGEACKNETKAQSASPGGGAPPASQTPQNDASKEANNPNDPTGCATNPTGQKCQVCTANPRDPSCQGAAQPQGTSSFDAKNDDPKTKADFDLPDVGSAQPMSYGGGGGAAGQPAKNGTIANNSGGGIPGAGGGGGGGGGGPQGRASSGSPGYTTDILQGYQSGSAQTAGGSLETGGEGGFAGYGHGQNQNQRDSSGIDLKQFLPGNRRAPASLGAAGYSLRPAEIGSKFGDIWEKVSRKYQDKCRHSQLIGCE